MSKISILPQTGLFDSQYHLAGFECYLKTHDYSHASIKMYLSSIRKLLEFLEIPLGDMNELHIIQYRDEMLGKQKLKSSTVNKNLVSIKAFILYLMEEGALMTDITKNVRPIKLQPKAVAPKAMTEKEVRSFLQTLARISKKSIRCRNEAIAKLALKSGLRVSEICSLDRGDIDLGLRSGYVHVRQGKGLKERSVFLNKVAREALDRYLIDFQKRRGAPLLDHEPMFQSEQKTRISARSIQIMIADVAKESKIERIKITPHVLRHTFATNYYQSSKHDVVGLASMMGHSSLNTTGIYAKPSEEQIMMDLDKI